MLIPEAPESSRVRYGRVAGKAPRVVRSASRFWLVSPTATSKARPTGERRPPALEERVGPSNTQVACRLGHIPVARDRVTERRRAVALARHFREAEGLSIAQIAGRLGRPPATVKAYFYDPTGENARAVKARHVGGCAAAVAPTRSRATARTTRTRTARPATRARSGGAGRASAFSRRCAIGGTARHAPARGALVPCDLRPQVERAGARDSPPGRDGR
jgi:AraC-like DNA-binding protein